MKNDSGCQSLLIPTRRSKPGMPRGLKVIDPTEDTLQNSLSLGNLFPLEVTERILSLKESWGKKSGVSPRAVTAAFKKAEGARSMVIWGLEALRAKLHDKGKWCSCRALQRPSLPSSSLLPPAAST